MGIYLSSPITAKDVENDAHCRYPYGAAAMQGWRRSQEDAHNCLPEFDSATQTGLFAVYDGHGGAEVANYCQRHLPAAITSAINSRKDIGEALKSAFLLTDAKLIEPEVMEELQTLGAVSSIVSLPPQGAQRTKRNAESQPLSQPAEKENGATSPPGLRLTAAKKQRTPLALSEFLKTARIYRASTGLVVDFDADDDDEPPPQRDDEDKESGKDATILADNTVAPLSLDDDDGPSHPKTSTPQRTQPPRLASTEPQVAAPQHVPGFDSGCTACVVLVRGAASEIVVANSGDSRCVLSCNGGRAVDLSFDHKPQDPVELQRIRLAGGALTFGNRINGGLNVSRCIGDHNYKSRNLPQQCQMVTALPDITTRPLTSDCEFLIVACDGIWNSMSSQAVVDFIRERLVRNTYVTLSDICSQLFDACLSPTPGGSEGGCDNMTCLIILLGADFRLRAINEKILGPGIDGQSLKVINDGYSSASWPGREGEQLFEANGRSRFRSVGKDLESNPVEQNVEPTVTSHLNSWASSTPERTDDFVAAASTEETSTDCFTRPAALESAQHLNFLTVDQSTPLIEDKLVPVQNFTEDRWLLQEATSPPPLASELSLNDDSAQREMQLWRCAHPSLTTHSGKQSTFSSLAHTDTAAADVTANASALPISATSKVHVNSQPENLTHLPDPLFFGSEIPRQSSVAEQKTSAAVVAEEILTSVVQKPERVQ